MACPDAVLDFAGSVDGNEFVLNGLVDGVGLEVLGSKDGGLLPTASPGENLEGTVPARALREEFGVLPSAGGIKSGNPSWLGDSGMVSVRGVEPPLAGGPHMPGTRPS